MYNFISIDSTEPYSCITSFRRSSFEYSRPEDLGLEDSGNMVATVTTPEETLPDFFPRVVKLCSKPADAFFKCISEKSVKDSNGDIEAGNRGVRACLKEKKLYETCMMKHDPKMNDPKRHRVRTGSVHFSFRHFDFFFKIRFIY